MHLYGFANWAWGLGYRVSTWHLRTPGWVTTVSGRTSSMTRALEGNTGLWDSGVSQVVGNPPDHAIQKQFIVIKCQQPSIFGDGLRKHHKSCLLQYLWNTTNARYRILRWSVLGTYMPGCRPVKSQDEWSHRLYKPYLLMLVSPVTLGQSARLPKKGVGIASELGYSLWKLTLKG